MKLPGVILQNTMVMRAGDSLGEKMREGGRGVINTRNLPDASVFVGNLVCSRLAVIINLHNIYHIYPHKLPEISMC